MYKPASTLFLIFLLSCPAFVISEEVSDDTGTPWVWAPQIQVGSRLSDFTLDDSNGRQHSTDELSGSSGYLLLFNRSVVW